MGSLWLAVRSVFWTIMLPGFITGYAPWRYLGLSRARPDLTDPLDLLALVIIAAGATLLAACIVEFARSGRGTLSPVDPPRELVVQGLYRWVRNPMYVGVMTILMGEALLLHSLTLLEYAAGVVVLFGAFVMLYEEPVLRRQFGASYDEYCARVGRWIPRVPR